MDTLQNNMGHPLHAVGDTQRSSGIVTNNYFLLFVYLQKLNMGYLLHAANKNNNELICDKLDVM